MQNVDDSWNRLVRGLLDGDEVVAREFHDLYAKSLRAIASDQMSAAVRSRFDAADAVQSALRTFFRRANDGQFQLIDSEKLWSLICAITLTKVREKTRFHLRHRRSVARETSLDQLTFVASAIDGNELTPDVTVAFADECAEFLLSLESEEARVVDMKLKNCFNDEIAKELGVSERTVTRILGKLERRMKQAFQV